MARCGLLAELGPKLNVLVPPDVANMTRLPTALAELPWGVVRELDASEVAARPITIVGDDPRVDILTVSWTVTFDRAWPDRRVRRIQGVRVPFLSLADLRASKQTGRPADFADLDAQAGENA